MYVGDIKWGFLLCVELIYDNVLEVFKCSEVLVFIIFGDNEWNDCL